MECPSLDVRHAMGAFSQNRFARKNIRNSGVARAEAIIAGDAAWVQESELWQSKSMRISGKSIRNSVTKFEDRLTANDLTHHACPRHSNFIFAVVLHKCHLVCSRLEDMRCTSTSALAPT